MKLLLSRRGAIWLAVFALFLAGLACWLTIFSRAHQEGDEWIYRALVQQLDAGRGYTLQGHPLLEEGYIVRETYGKSLFFHPPGGLGFFWIMHRFFGETGFGLAQLVSYTVFFWAIMLLAKLVLDPMSNLQAIVTASLSAFTPIMTHVTARFWLDGPLLAAATGAVALFLLAYKREKLLWACAAGVLLGYAALIKPTAILILPGLVALAWAVGPRNSWRTLTIYTLFVLGIAACFLLPWEVYRWTVVGNPFAISPGRPAPELVATNRYVYFLTVVRSPWSYLSLLPRVVWTVVPSLLLLAFQWPIPAVRRIGLALLIWIAFVLAVNIGLGFVGYSKLLRYVILLTPATILLFSLVVGSAWERLASGQSLPGGKIVTSALLALALVGGTLEIVQGIKNPLEKTSDLILPLWGRE